MADLFLASFRATYDFPLAHPDDDVRRHVRDDLIGAGETWVAVEAPFVGLDDPGSAGIVGFMTVADGELDQLYVRPDRLGHGFGVRLLALAKARQPRGLGLYTFQVNARARRFYERNGFTVVDLNDGDRNEERQPDIRYAWHSSGSVTARSVVSAAPAAPVLEMTRSADGTAIASHRTGSGAPLVLVHGATSDHATFRVVGPMLAAGHEIHAIDRRGRAGSGDGPAYAIEREYEDVAAVVDAVAASAGGPVDVVGHSFGGAVALGAATLTSNIRRLVMYESAPAVPGLDEPSSEIVGRLAALDRAGDRPALLRTFMRDVVGVSAEKLAEFEASPVYPDRLAAAPTVLRELVAGGPADPAVAARLASAITIPVLQLLGSASGSFFRDATLALHAALPDGRIVILDGQRHAAHHEAPAVFVAEVEAFLGR